MSLSPLLCLLRHPRPKASIPLVKQTAGQTICLLKICSCLTSALVKQTTGQANHRSSKQMVKQTTGQANHWSNKPLVKQTAGQANPPMTCLSCGNFWVSTILYPVFYAVFSRRIGNNIMETSYITNFIFRFTDFRETRKPFCLKFKFDNFYSVLIW